MENSEVLDRDKSEHLPYLFVGGFGVNEGAFDDFQNWYKQHLKAITDGCPKGVRFVGIYVVRHTSEKNSGEFRIVWEFGSYGSQDALGKELKSNGALDFLTKALAKFTNRHADWSQSLCRRFEDTDSFIYFD